MSRELTRQEKAAIRSLVKRWCANYDKDCMTADALATAFMVMGLEEAEAFCKADTTIDAYFIYSGENGEFKTYYTEGMKKYITTP